MCILKMKTRPLTWKLKQFCSFIFIRVYLCTYYVGSILICVFLVQYFYNKKPFIVNLQIKDFSLPMHYYVAVFLFNRTEY